MAIQYSIAVNNARLDAVESTIGVSPDLVVYSGAQPANCAAADPSGTLVTITLPSDWMAAASSATKAKTGTWSGTASGGSSTAPLSWRIIKTAACGMQGSAAVGSGDLNFNGSITSGQTITVSTFTITAANQ